MRLFVTSSPESVSPPQILAKAVSVTPGWRNVTLECRAAGATENLNVTWESKGLPRELELSGTPGPALNPWTQAVSLPLSQAHARLTCLVNNPMDQNDATLDLGDICSRGECHLLEGGVSGAQGALESAGPRLPFHPCHDYQQLLLYLVPPLGSLESRPSHLCLSVSSHPCPSLLAQAAAFRCLS